MLQELERRGKPDQETFMHWVHRRAKKGTFAIHLGLLAFLPFTYRAFGSCTCPDPPPRDGGACGPGHLRGTDQQLVAQPVLASADCRLWQRLRGHDPCAAAYVA